MARIHAGLEPSPPPPLASGAAPAAKIIGGERRFEDHLCDRQQRAVRAFDFPARLRPKRSATGPWVLQKTARPTTPAWADVSHSRMAWQSRERAGRLIGPRGEQRGKVQPPGQGLTATGTEWAGSDFYRPAPHQRFHAKVVAGSFSPAFIQMGPGRAFLRPAAARDPCMSMSWACSTERLGLVGTAAGCCVCDMVGALVFLDVIRKRRPRFFSSTFGSGPQPRIARLKKTAFRSSRRRI